MTHLHILDCVPFANTVRQRPKMAQHTILVNSSVLWLTVLIQQTKTTLMSYQRNWKMICLTKMRMLTPMSQVTRMMNRMLPNCIKMSLMTKFSYNHKLESRPELYPWIIRPMWCWFRVGTRTFAVHGPISGRIKMGHVQLTGRKL